jgi:pilus assembly protein CpaB
MPSPRKPKKAIVFFLIAAAVAGVFCLVALGITFFMISNANSAGLAAQQQAAEEAKKAKEELERLKNSIKETPVVQEEQHRQLQALSDIPAGTQIRDNMLASVNVKEDELVPGALSDEFEAIGKIAITPIKAGDVLTKNKLMVNEGGFYIKDGMRAITVQVDQIGGLNGAIVPGSFVDILSVFNAGNEKVSKTILQNVQVIAVGGAGAAAQQPKQKQSMYGNSSSGTGNKGTKLPNAGGAITSVTLAVTPQEAELLTIANSEGQFHLTLRNEQDKQIAKVRGSNLNQMITGAAPSDYIPRKLPAPPRFPGSARGEIPINFADTPPGGLPYPAGPEPPDKSFTMTIYKGSKPEEQTFEVQ